MGIVKEIKEKSCLILGFGREGTSTYQFIRQILPLKKLVVADGNTNLDCSLYVNDSNLTFILGDRYLEAINDFELVIKSPGVSLQHFEVKETTKISSQTDIFLQLYGNQTIGITGTKGKSTTTSLIYHLLKQQQKPILLAGNMGIPLFDIVDKITPDTFIVCEFSSHQLEYLTQGPHIAIFLNLFEEHLDHYKSYLHYQMAKLNIGLKQGTHDYFVYNSDDETIAKLMHQFEVQSAKLPFSSTQSLSKGIYLKSPTTISVPAIENQSITLNGDLPLKGEHNKKNIMAASLVAMILGVSTIEIENGLKTFAPLPHRLEYIGKIRGIDFYNDSISTIPQATIEALNTLPKTETLILGGFDRGIDYAILIDHLAAHPVSNLIFTGEAGKRMMEIVKSNSKIHSNIFFETEYEAIVEIAFNVTKPGNICLLSPAASSYDRFKNFEHRGDFFRQMIFSKKEK